jgi:Sulfotransferase family
MKLLPPVRDASRFSPVFVLATARSYSSVVATMIGQHPQCASLPELKLFAYPTIGELEASLPRFWSDQGITHRSPGLVRAVAQLQFNNQQAESLASARAWLRDRSDWEGSQVLDSLLEVLAPRTAVEKSPENVVTNDSLNRLAFSYPNARYVHLTRHPVTTQRSLEQHLDRMIPGFALPDQPMSGIASWVEIQCRILRFTSTIPARSFIRVRAEDVLNDSRSQLRSIAQWLGVRADEDAIESMMHPEYSPFARPGDAATGIVGGHDPNFLRDPIPRRAPELRALLRPEGWVNNAELWQMTVDVADRLGYS